MCQMCQIFIVTDHRVEFPVTSGNLTGSSHIGATIWYESFLSLIVCSP